MTIYVNFDIETTGPVPGLFSMVSFGAIAHRDPDFACVGQFEINIKEMEGAGWDPNTKEWWESPEQANAFERTFDEPRVHVDTALGEICAWLSKLLKGPGEGPIVFVAYPANFDMAFFNYYMHRFASEEWRKLTFNKNVGWSCMDVLTLAAAILDRPYLESTKRHWPEEWEGPNSLPHTAMEDARSQATSFIAMMRTMRGLRRLGSVHGSPMVDVEGLIAMGTDHREEG